MPTQHWWLSLLAACERTVFGAVGRTYLSVNAWAWVAGIVMGSGDHMEGAYG